MASVPSALSAACVRLAKLFDMARFAVVLLKQASSFTME